MRIWVVTIGEPIPTDAGGTDRLYRTGLLANILATHGHEVVWWNSTFDHVRKRQRFPTDTTLRMENGVLLALLHGCGYATNISWRRVIDHAMLAYKFSRQASKMPRPDVILCSLPPLELPAAVARYGMSHQVPVVVDVRDLWPDIFLELVPQRAQPVLNMALTPLWRQAKAACGNAFALTGNSPYFVEWGLKLASRRGTELDRAFPHGYASAIPEPTKLDAAREFWTRQGVEKDGGAFVACFFGAIGPQSELETVIAAARILDQHGRRFRFVLCGRGDHLESLRSMSADVSSVLFPGWVGAAEIWVLMRMSMVGLAVYRSNVGYVTNLPNKPIEYLSAGLPVVSSLKGYLERFLADNGCGVTYPNGDAEALARTLMHLDDNRESLLKMSANAHRVFRDKFDADTVYAEMAQYLERVAAAYAEEKCSSGNS